MSGGPRVAVSRDASQTELQPRPIFLPRNRRESVTRQPSGFQRNFWMVTPRVLISTGLYYRLSQDRRTASVFMNSNSFVAHAYAQNAGDSHVTQSRPVASPLTDADRQRPLFGLTVTRARARRPGGLSDATVVREAPTISDVYYLKTILRDGAGHTGRGTKSACRPTLKDS